MLFRIIWLTFILLSVSEASAQAGCPEFARTELERLYCQINAASPGIVPGTLRDFRKNPPATQRLLLQRPAARLGLTLPGKRASPGSSPSSPAIAPAVNPENHSVGSRPAKRATGSAPTSPAERRGAEICRLQHESIHCGNRHYRLLSNEPNAALPKDALGPANRLDLDLEPVTGHIDDYLEQSYLQYIDKMVSIGLAGVTMSYTKFHHFYEEAVELGASFPDRMAKMFEYLKKDKIVMAAGARGGQAQPGSIAACYPLGTDYYICDDVATNWVYRAF